jgi:hypothetical protein
LISAALTDPFGMKKIMNKVATAPSANAIGIPMNTAVSVLGIEIASRLARSGPDAGLVKGEGFAVDASVMEADTSRYHGKAPGEIDWSAAGNVLGASAITAARLA